jgi:polysaccharide export outer membrane protein
MVSPESVSPESINPQSINPESGGRGTAIAPAPVDPHNGKYKYQHKHKHKYNASNPGLPQPATFKGRRGGWLPRASASRSPLGLLAATIAVGLLGIDPALALGRGPNPVGQANSGGPHSDREDWIFPDVPRQGDPIPEPAPVAPAPRPVPQPMERPADPPPLPPRPLSPDPGLPPEGFEAIDPPFSSEPPEALPNNRPLPSGPTFDDLPPELFAEPETWRIYRLAPLDQISVQVPGYSELSFFARIDPDGRILVPLVGFMNVEGLTLQELQGYLQRAFNRFVVDPEPIVVLQNQVNPDVVVTGEVVKPGFYRVGPYETAIAALLSAGGATDQADLRAVKLRRPLPDGSTLEQTINLLSLLAEGRPEPRIFLQDGDVLEVPRLEPGHELEYDAALAARSNLARATIQVRLLSYAGRGGMRVLNLPSGSSFVDVMSNAPIDEVRLRRIALIRFDPQVGRPVTRILDGQAAFMGDPSQNPLLRHNDVVVLNRDLIARISYALNRFTRPFRDILGFLLFFREIDSAATELFGPQGVFGGSEEGEGSNDNNN